MGRLSCDPVTREGARYLRFEEDRIEMKRLILGLVAVLVCILLVSGCGSTTPTTTLAPAVTASQPPASSAVTSAPVSKPPVATTVAARVDPNTPVQGGTLKCIRGAFPAVLGYPPEMGPADSFFDLPYAERLSVWDPRGNMIPELAESWDIDPVNKTITWRIRKGVQFHDGTPLNAAAVSWNFQLLQDNRKLTYGKYLKSLDVLDEYTLRMNLTEFNTQAVATYSMVMIFSPQSIAKNGKEWARTHGVGTGPFKLADFQRDSLIKYVRNENYWRKGNPYLDAIEVRLITDAAAASAMIQSKEADIWLDVSDIPSLVDLEKKGLKINRGPGMSFQILAGSADPNSLFSRLEVRQAMACAIDRKTMAQALGKGQFEPMSQLVTPGSPAYVKGYDPDPYDPARAKQLLAKAGSPSGFKTTLLAESAGGGKNDTAEAVKVYFDAVGLRTSIDIVDQNKYSGAVFGTGFTDMVLSSSVINPDATDLYIHFGPDPLTYRTGNIKKSPTFLDLCTQALHAPDKTKELALMQQAVKQAGEDETVIPLYRSAQSSVMQTYVHSDYLKIHSTVWYSYQDWMDKH
jgi:peptide/nickel transport system substrate-binding protein